MTFLATPNLQAGLQHTCCSLDTLLGCLGRHDCATMQCLALHSGCTHVVTCIMAGNKCCPVSLNSATCMQGGWGVMNTADALKTCNGWTYAEAVAFVMAAGEARNRHTQAGDWAVDLTSIDRVRNDLNRSSSPQVWHSVSVSPALGILQLMDIHCAEIGH